MIRHDDASTYADLLARLGDDGGAGAAGVGEPSHHVLDAALADGGGVQQRTEQVRGGGLTEITLSDAHQVGEGYEVVS